MFKDLQMSLATDLMNPGLSRRRFVQGSVGGLLLGFFAAPTRMVQGAPATPQEQAMAAFGGDSGFTPNAYVHIDQDGIVHVAIKHLDMGQGAYQGLATLVAEELDADWSKVRAEGAPAISEVYKNNFFGMQGVGGSSGLGNSYEQFRQAGAAARAMLVAAAAERWKVKPEEVQVENGILSHAASGKKAGFAELVGDAAKQKIPEKVSLKSPEQFRLIGKETPRIDSLVKSTGKALFTLDVQMPNLLTVLVARPPVFGAKLLSFDDKAALAVKGVQDVQQIPSGVAVYALDFWSAKKGRDALKTEWDLSTGETRSSDQLLATYKDLAKKPGDPVTHHGDADAALSNADQVIEAEYSFPYLAHAPLEPLDCVIEPTENGVKASYGCQMQTTDQATIAKILGLTPDQVDIKTLFAGGGFGRRAQQNSDLAAEAAEIYKAQKTRQPIKLVWTREDDIHGGFYRPMMVHRVRGGVKGGQISAWEHVIVGQSILKDSAFEGMIKDGIDATSVEGANELPYSLPNHRLTLHSIKVGVPVLWWRSVGSTHTAFVVETFLDDLIHQLKGDPVTQRMALLKESPRELGVLKAVAQAANWKGPKVDGNRARGVAVHKSFHTYVAQIAEVSKGSNGLPKVEKVWCAVDCGLAVNPDVVRAQMEGGIGFGLGAALYNAITLKNGVVQQNNFDAYLPLRMPDMPAIEVVIVNSGAAPTGVGEPGVPPIAPAVGNAWFALTGERVRDLPFRKT